jgi:multidrug efflux system outer membrane protein
LRVARQRLATLLARAPGSELPTGPASLPELPRPPPTGSPADLLHARPDLRGTEHRFEGAAARRRSAERGFLPSLGINGNAGWGWRDSNGFEDTGLWGFGASLEIPIFNGGATIAAARAARAAQRNASSTLHQLVLGAVGEVEDGLVRRSELQAQLAAQQDQLKAAEAAFATAQDHYLSGTGDYLTVLSTFHSLQQVELSELSLRRALLGVHLRLRLALGGDWTRNLQASAE